MRIICLVIIIICVICLVSSIIDTHRFVVRHYELESDKICKDMRFVLISDLHNKDYGSDNASLLSAIDNESPDAVLIAGDLINGSAGSDRLAATGFAIELAKRYPVYYGMGNHETKIKQYPERFDEKWEIYESALTEKGIHLLDNERIVVEEAGVDIAALSLDRTYYKKFIRKELDSGDISPLIGDASSDKMQILIAHNPDYFEAYADWGADLTVSGHLHGGIMRLPVIGGVISPRITPFPRYSGGEYCKGTSKMIVSCGLGMHTINLRVFNPGELSVIDIHRGNNGNTGNA